MSDALKLDRRGISTTQGTAPATHEVTVGVKYAEPYHAAPTVNGTAPKPTLADTEIGRLRFRMEALEHLVIILLADTKSRDVDAVRELLNETAFWTDPSHNAESRRAAAHMIRLVERSDRMRSGAAAGVAASST